MRRSGCLLVVVLLARGLAAQTAGEPNPRHNWVDHLYPAIWYSSIDGFWLAGHYDWSSPMGFAERPEPTFARIALDAGASTQGSYSIIADAQAPAYWDGWRFGLTAGLIRANRFGYYGQGNSTTYDRDSVEVAVRLTSPDDALDEEMRLIRRLQPRDNLIGQPDLAEAPF